MKRDIELLLIKLADGGRIMRWSEPGSGLSLEKRIDATDSIARQKERWRRVFVAMLDRELGAAVAALLLLAFIAAGCGRSGVTHWQDGNFKVYATDTDFNATKLGYNHRPGLLGLVAAEVVAAGSNVQFVFVERIDPMTGRSDFYLVPKEDSLDTHSGSVEGPYSRSEFQQLRISHKLPDFNWRKSQLK